MPDRQEIYNEQCINASNIDQEVVRPNKTKIKQLLLSFKDENLLLGDLIYEKSTKKWYAVATSVQNWSPVAAVIPIESSDQGIWLGEKVIISSSSFKPKDIFSNYIKSLGLSPDQPSQIQIEQKQEENKKT